MPHLPVYHSVLLFNAFNTFIIVDAKSLNALMLHKSGEQQW